MFFWLSVLIKFVEYFINRAQTTVSIIAFKLSMYHAISNVLIAGRKKSGRREGLEENVIHSLINIINTVFKYK